MRGAQALRTSSSNVNSSKGTEVCSEVEVSMESDCMKEE